MDDSAGQSVGEYEAAFDQLGRPKPPSRTTSMTMPTSASTRPDANKLSGNGAGDGRHLMSLDAIVTGRHSNLNECIDELDKRRSFSIDRRAADTAAMAYDRRAAALAADFNAEHGDLNLSPSRWWFASSAFPMIAATLGPVASAFSICALVRPWRQVILAGETIDTAQFTKDPIWLTCINAVQLAIALVSNMFLLLNMARRPITMTGWYFSSLALIALVSTASGPLKDDITLDGQLVWSQAFYYAIYAAILYMLVASLMVVTFFGAATGHYPKDFQLTNSQRTLMLQTIMFLMYLLIGALIYSNIEGWSYLDAVYWADVTLFTIGFGDFAAQTTLGRSLLFPFALIGIISLGLVIGSIRSLALERGRRRLDARMTEKNRRKFLNTLHKKGKDDILRPIRDRRESIDGAPRGDYEGASSFEGPRPNTTGLTEYERREEEFNIMRKIQHRAAQRRRWFAMATSGGTWLALWLIGAYIFQTCEHPYQGWNYFDGFYLAFVSLTTIGYGDMVPISNAGRSFFVFWSLLALPTTTILISNAGDTIVKAISDATNAVGRVTILPGERGLKRDLKEVLRVLTCGVVFDDADIEESPPGLLGAAQQPPEQREESLAEEQEEEEEEAEEAVNEAEGVRRDQNPSDDDENATQGGGSGSSDKAKNGNEADGNDKDATKTRRPKSGNRTVGNASSGPRDTEKTNREDYAFQDQPNPVTNDGLEQQDNVNATPSKDLSPLQNTPQRPVMPLRKSSTAPVEMSEQPEIKRALSDLSQSSTKATNSGDGTASMSSRRTRTGDQSPSSRRGTMRSGNSSGSNATAREGGDASGFAFGSVPSMSVPRIDLPQELPASRAEYHCVLIDEIAHVTEHLRHSPPRKYTFQEWAWFLKLIGEDERNADLHRRARMKTHKKSGRGHGGDGGDTDPKDTKSSVDLNPDNEDPARLQWSWVGARSPLMSTQEEAEWILDKLTKRLQAELRTTREAIALYRKHHSKRLEQEEEEEQLMLNQSYRNQPGSDDAEDDEDGRKADPGPYSRSGQLKRRETHSIKEES
ncbi:potassium channel [Sporothrix schenckii 1099-18]|uniref:Potassium channel n=1 Tax=Sporothrix schenckii 1099-18 TaxID=1397361 RepID=A0A0F2MHA4_SPOSC|nr:potassium channel [Sporothrix schenckii 1099-18]KJR88245.1 potassium channel [Sporothrix schenckii 1099-18]